MKTETLQAITDVYIYLNRCHKASGERIATNFFQDYTLSTIRYAVEYLIDLKIVSRIKNKRNTLTLYKVNSGL